MNVYRALITFKWWHYFRTGKKELTLHLLRNRFRVTLWRTE